MKKRNVDFRVPAVVRRENKLEMVEIIESIVKIGKRERKPQHSSHFIHFTPEGRTSIGKSEIAKEINR